MSRSPRNNSDSELAMMFSPVKANMNADAQDRLPDDEVLAQMK